MSRPTLCIARQALKIDSVAQEKYPAVWSFCPQGQLIVAWQASAPEPEPMVLIYDLHLQVLCHVAGATLPAGSMTQNTFGVLPEHLAARPDGNALLKALHPLLSSLSGLLVETGMNSPTTPMLTFSQEGGVLLVTGFAIAYRAGPYIADLTYIVPRQDRRLVKGETCPLTCSWLHDGNLACRYPHKVDILDTSKHEIYYSLHLQELAGIVPTTIRVMAVSPDSRFAAILAENTLVMLHFSSRTAVRVRALSRVQARSAVWNTAGDKLLVGHSKGFYIFTFGRLPGVSVAQMANVLS